VASGPRGEGGTGRAVLADRQPLLVRGGLVFTGLGPSGRPVGPGEGRLEHLDLRVGPAGTVTELGPSLRPGEGEAVLDAGGLVVAPGFVDLHSHSDLYALWRRGRPAPLGDEPKLVQGCTAQVFGQDGISAAPVGAEGPAALAEAIAGLDGRIPLERWRWQSVGEYLAALRREATTRVAVLVGHSTVRRLVMGTADRPPSPEELRAMQAVVDRAMAEGALGLSTGLVYVPAAYAGVEELVALCEVVARWGGRFFVHVRSESDRVVEATEEVVEVARRSGVHLHYSHIKTAGRRNWPLAPRLLEILEAHRAAGFPLSADVHPYTAGSTTAAVLLPPWVLEGGVAAAVTRLGDPAVRARIREQLLGDTTSWDNWWAFSGGWQGLVVADAPRPGLAGRSFAEVVAAAGVGDPHSQAAFDVVLDLLREARLAVSLVSFNNVEENVARFLAQPWAGVGSDALVNPDGHPHPRLYGTFPRVLGRFVRELGALDLVEALRSMTVGAAEAAGWTARGILAPGVPADLVVLDPERVADRATYEEPRLPPVGIQAVLVGGRQVAAAGRLTGPVPPAEDRAEDEPGEAEVPGGRAAGK
jgi:N-acyl-D-amino-acid deacylase